MTISEWLRRRVEANILTDRPGTCSEYLARLNANNILGRFVALMHNRLLVGGFRYGVNRLKNQRRYNNIRSAQERLELYLETGNQEHLVDAANLCAVEFTYPDCHPNPHFEATDDTTTHTQEIT